MFVRKETAPDRRHRKNIFAPNTRSVLVMHNRTLDSLAQAVSSRGGEKYAVFPTAMTKGSGERAKIRMNEYSSGICGTLP